MTHTHSPLLILNKKKRVRILPKIWGRSGGLLFCLFFGVAISLVSNKVFLVWVGLEVNMFGIIPFLNSNNTKNTLLLTRSEIKASFFYFLVQVIGRLLFAWGRILREWYIIRVIGLIIKIGTVPFIWWVPSIICRLDWISIGIIRTIQKIPSIVLLRIIFDIDFKLCLYVRLVGFALARVGIKFSQKKLKLLISWSSISKMRILLVLLVVKNMLGLLYYIFYRILTLIFCGVLKYSDNGSEGESFIKGTKNNVKILSRFILLIFSGLPPMIRFLIKVFFFRGILAHDRAWRVMDLRFKGKEIAYFFLVSYMLENWRLVMVLVILIIIQSIGYIKAFIKIYSTRSSRLTILSKKTKGINEWIFLRGVIIYVLSLILIWI